MAGDNLDCFDALLAQASTCGPHGARVLLEAALALVRGEFVEDEPYASWTQTHRQVFHVRLMRARLDAADSALACRDLDAARSHAERALFDDHLNEEAVRVLVAAAYASGRQEEALRQFEECRRRLREELGVEPMPATAALHSQVLQHRPAAEVLPPPAWDRLPLALDLRSAKVPFIDRVEEAAQLRSAVRAGLDGTYAFIIVEGRSGFGKTRLIDHVVSQVSQARVGKARCARVEQGLPFVPIAMALRAALPPDAFDPLSRLLPQLSAHPGEAGMLRALEELAEAALASGPTVLVLDDIHWADESTIIALSYLRHRCHDAPLVIVSAVDALDSTSDRLINAFQTVPQISLGPFTRSAVDALGHPGLFERTRGHPMFVAECLEVAREGCENELLLRLQPWVLEQAAQAGEDASLLLVAAAALARPFAPEELAMAVQANLESVSLQLEALHRRGLVAVHVDGFILESPLLAEVLLSTMSPSRQRLVRERLQHHGLRDLLATGRRREEVIEHERAE